MTMTAKAELTTERVIVAGAGVILTAGMLWLGATVQQSARELAELRIEMRSLVQSVDRDSGRADRQVNDHEARIRRLEQWANQRARESREREGS